MNNTLPTSTSYLLCSPIHNSLDNIHKQIQQITNGNHIPMTGKSQSQFDLNHD